MSIVSLIQQLHDTMFVYRVSAGGSSACGGKWKPNPNKPTDSRYLGEPGEIKVTVMPNGEYI